MTDREAALKQLQFEAPDESLLQGWETAEAQSFRFSQKYVARCQEFNEYAKGLEALESEKNRLFGYVVRNVIGTLDNVQTVLQEVGHPLSALEDADSQTDERIEDAAADDVGTEPVDDVEPENAPTDEPGTTAENVTEGEPSSPQNESDSDGESGDVEFAEADASEVTTPLDPVAALSVKSLQSVQRSLVSLLEGLHIHQVDLRGQTYGGVVVNGTPIPDPFEIIESTGSGKAAEQPVVEVLADLWVQTEPGIRVIRKGRVIC